LCYALQFGGIIHIDLASDPEVGLSERCITWRSSYVLTNKFSLRNAQAGVLLKEMDCVLKEEEKAY
jgi:hypothetical protein